MMAFHAVAQFGTTPDIEQLVLQHNLSDPQFVHDNLQPTDCACRPARGYAPAVVARPPNYTGNFCGNCGGIMQRTGACETCTSCATATSCG